MSIFKRIVKVVISAIFMFIALAVLNKLFLEKETWLYDATIWTIAWTIANCIAKVLWTFGIDSRTNVLISIVVIAIAFLMLSFVFGVIFNYEEWKSAVAEVMIPFGMSIIVHSMDQK